MLVNEILDGVKVLITKSQQRRDFGGPPTQAVGQPVGQRRGAKTTISPGRATSNATAFENYHAPFRVFFLGKYRGPEPTEPGSNYTQVGGRVRL